MAGRVTERQTPKHQSAKSNEPLDAPVALPKQPRAIFAFPQFLSRVLGNPGTRLSALRNGTTALIMRNAEAVTKSLATRPL